MAGSLKTVAPAIILSLYGLYLYMYGSGCTCWENVINNKKNKFRSLFKENMYYVRLRGCWKMTQEVKNGMRSPDWHVARFDIHPYSKTPVRLY